MSLHRLFPTGLFLLIFSGGPTFFLSFSYAATPPPSKRVIAPPPARQAALINMVREDCGSCHGSRLTGGLGPALTPQALTGKDPISLENTILSGRPDTPMPPWKPFLSETEAAWIVKMLMKGFPDAPL